MTSTPSLGKATLAVACGLALLAACDRGGKEIDFRRNRDGKGTPVAKFGGDAITAEDLKERFAEMPPYERAGFESVDKRRELVEGMARFELLAAEALARGLQNDPAVVEVAKKAMVDRLLKQEFAEKSTPIPDADVAAYYEAHKADFVKPEMVRLSYLFLGARDSDPKARAEKKAKAEALVAQARAMPAEDFTAFGKLVAENSEHEESKPLRGDLRFLSQDDLRAKFGPQVADAAPALKTLGQVSDVIETPEGFHVLKLHTRQGALNLGVDEVRTQIQRKLLTERRAADFNRFIEKLKEQHKYALDDQALAGIEIDLKAPPKESQRPPPGFIPPVAGGAPLR